jgi:tetratricopeptide (TPR) repeat protein
MIQNANERLKEALTLLANQDQVDGAIMQLKEIYPYISEQNFSILMARFDNYITKPFDVFCENSQGAFGSAYGQGIVTVALGMLDDLADMLDSTPPNYLHQENYLTGLSTAYSRVGIRYFNISKELDSLELIQKSISIFEKSTAFLQKTNSNSSLEPYNQKLAMMYVVSAQHFGKQERWKEQIPFLKKAVELDPQNDVAWLMLGYSYWPEYENRELFLNCWTRAAELGNAKAIAELKNWKN